ncbi:hypothetical protein J6590_097820 [Homalodisca vitripennis]|nr:hypothetical protein J6590_097820 [Homalodisca vitripennis]
MLSVLVVVNVANSKEPFGVVEEQERKPVVGAHVWNVVLPCDIEVPELSEILVACVLKPTVKGQRFVNVDEVYVEPVSSELQVSSNEFDDICVARVVSKVFKDSGVSLVQCRLLNPHRSSVVLKKGKWLGIAAELGKDEDNVICVVLNQELFVKSNKKCVKSSVEEQSCEIIVDCSVGKRMKKEVGGVALESDSNGIVGGVALESDSNDIVCGIALVNKSEGGLALLNDSSESEGGLALVNKCEGGLALVNSDAGGKAWQSSDSGGEAVCSKISKEAELTLGKLTASVVKREYNEVWSQL